MLRILITIVLCLPLLAIASQERIHLWESASYQLTLPEPYGKVELSVKFSQGNIGHNIESMSLAVGNKIINIPNKAFSDLTQIQTNSIRIHTELHSPYDFGAGIYIVFNYGNEGQHTAHIVTYDLKLVSRNLRVKTSETTWQHQKMKF